MSKLRDSKWGAVIKIVNAGSVLNSFHTELPSSAEKPGRSPGFENGTVVGQELDRASKFETSVRSEALRKKQEYGHFPCRRRTLRSQKRKLPNLSSKAPRLKILAAAGEAAAAEPRSLLG